MLALMLCCLLSCAGRKKLFDVPASINLPALDEVAATIKHDEPGDPLPVFDRALLFKTSFRLRNVETGHVLDDAILHDSDLVKPASYYPNVKGAKQELYLLELPAQDGRNYFVYFSIWSNTGDTARRMRFGPAYLGKLSPVYATINFNHDVKPDLEDGHLYFYPQKAGRGFSFVLDTLLFRHPLPPGKNRIGINRIILTEMNKIAGSKKYVYAVPGSKLEKLIFSCTDTLQLH
jgi:hypothetical protein